MSSTVDNRILEMRFDNKQFENGVQTSLNTLNNLKKGLDMSDSARGLESISQSASRISFGGLSEGVEAVRVKFSALQVAAVTCFSNMINSAWNAGTRIVSALTVDPVKTGFSEYETQINSVQTILANTQEHQKQVSQEAVQSVEETAAASAQAAIASNEASLNSLKKTQKQMVKEYNKLAEERLDILGDTYDDELKALNKSIEAENKALKNAHKEKLALYEEEYMEKLRIVDEERYNKIKAIDEEIDAINALTDSEEEAIKKEKEQEKLAALENAVLYAESIEEREEAEKDLADYKAELAREQLLKERDEQIKQLKLSKDSINEEYDLIEKNLKTEYEQKKESAQELYELELEQLKEAQDAQKELLKDTYDEQKKLLQEQIELEKEALEEQHTAELEALENSHKIALQNIEEEKNARIKALTASVGMTEASSLEDVNAALDELNAYADKTIYNFTEMTRNIGTFTAAGIDLDTSVAAIKGIANLAAISGSTSQQASTAMYQLSQALSSGTVRLMDWNSVVNAGMGGQVFQDALKETARVHGIAIDEIIASEGSFRESLSKGWLSADILTETLSKFTGDLTEAQLESMGYNEEQIAGIIKMGQTANDAATKVKTFTQLFDTLKEAAQSGWTSTWEIIVGDFEEAKELLTGISDTFGEIIGTSADARNSMLKNWKDLGGRNALIEGAKAAFEGLLSVITPVKEAFKEIFPPITGETLYNITIGLKNLMEKLKLSETQSDNLKTTFKGLFAALDIVKQAFTAVWNAIKPLLGVTGTLVDKTLEATAAIGQWLLNLRDSIKETDAFNTAIGAVVTGIKKFVSFVKEIAQSETLVKFANNAKEQFGLLLEHLTNFIGKVKEKFEFPGMEMFYGFLVGICDRMSSVKDAADEMKTNVVNSVNSMSDSVGESPIIKFFNNLWEGIKKIATGIGNAASNIASGLGEVLTGDNFFEVIGGLSIGAVAVGITKFIKSLTGTFDELGNITSNIVGILDGVKGCFEAYQNSLRADALMTIATAIALLTAAIVVLAMVDADKLTSGIMAISTLFAELIVSMNLFAKSSGSLIKTSTACIAFSIAIGIMAISLAALSKLDQNGISTGLFAMAGLAVVVVAAAKIMSSGSGQLVTGATSLIAFSLAITILASACKNLSGLNTEELIKGLAGVGVLLAEVALFLNVAKFSSKATGTAIGMVILAAALKILADVCEDFAGMGWEEIAKGLVGVGALLTEIALFTNLTGNASHVIATSASLVIIAAALKVLASAMGDFGTLSWEEIAKGLVAMGVALAEIAIAINLMPKNVVSKSVGLIAMAAALNILASAVDSMGGMSWEELAKGLIAMGVALAELAIALNAMNGTLAGSAALLVASTSLLALAPALKILGSMSWESIAKGMITLAGAFTVMGVAGAVLAPLAPTILAISAAFTLIGVGVAGIGAGLLAAATGLTALAAGFSALASLGAHTATLVVESLTTIITGIAETIVVIGRKLGEAIVAFGQAIIYGAPVICEAVTTVIRAVITSLLESVPLIVEGVVQILSSTLETIATYTPSIMESILNIITTVISSIAENMPAILQSVFDILTSVLNAIVEYAPEIIASVLQILSGSLKAIADNLDEVISAAVDVVISFIEGITDKLPDVIQAGFDLLISFLQGITKAVEENTPTLVETMKELFLALLDAAIEVLKGGIDLVWEAGKKIIDSGLIQGIWSKLKDFTRKIGELISEGITTIKNKLPEWLEKGKELIVNVISGISDKFTAFTDKVKELIADGLQKIKDKFSEWTQAGKDLISKVVSGISSKFSSVKYEVEDLIDNAKEAITDKFTEWKNIGKDLIDGLISGITSMASNAVDAVKDFGSDLLDGLKKVLGINSPSKEFAEIGRYADEGLIVGLKNYAGQVVNTAKDVGRNALTAMSDAISGVSDLIQNGDDWTPTIRPVIDLSNIESGAKSINAMFSRNQALQISGRMTSSAIAAYEGNGVNGGSTQGTTYQFTQNNYSPKALSRADIYRQTKNQFSALKGLVES